MSAPPNELASPSALIIGGTGGIGGAIIEALVREGKFTVHGTTRKPLASSPGVTWHQLDITDESSVAQLAADLDRLDLVILMSSLMMYSCGARHLDDIADDVFLWSLYMWIGQ